MDSVLLGKRPFWTIRMISSDQPAVRKTHILLAKWGWICGLSKCSESRIQKSSLSQGHPNWLLLLCSPFIRINWLFVSESSSFRWCRYLSGFWMVLWFRQSLPRGRVNPKIYMCTCIRYPLRGDGQPLERCLHKSSANCSRFSLCLLYFPRARSRQSGFSTSHWAIAVQPGPAQQIFVYVTNSEVFITIL